MDFCVKGITFNSHQLLEIPLSSFDVNKISRFHIFYMLGSGRKCILLLRAGEIISQAFIEKYQSKNVNSLMGLEVVKEHDLVPLKDLWNQLKAVSSQKKQLEIKDEILLKFMHDNEKSSDYSILNFVISCHEEFYQFPNDLLLKFQNKSYPLFTRSLLVATFSVVSSMAHDICDYSFLEDFYNISLFLDYGLIESSEFNYMISMACETERKKPGSGTSYLELHQRSDAEIYLFKDHPNRSARFLKEYKDYLNHAELIEFVKFHHEKKDGSGFPKGLYYSGLSQTEMLLAFCDNLVPFEEHIFMREDGYKFVSMYFENLTTLTKSRMIPIVGIIEAWKSLIKWNQKKGNIA